MNCGLRNSEENHSNAWSIELLLDAKRKFASQGFCLSYPPINGNSFLSATLRCLKVQDSGHNGVFIKLPLKCNSKFGLLQNKFENLQSLRFYRKKQTL